ncbi:MAG: phosphodiester glycosidase family protein [Pseudomonadota bacterium]
MIVRLLVALGIGIAASVAAADCTPQQDQQNRYSVCVIDPKVETIDLWLADESGAVYGNFAPLNAALAKTGQTLDLAMNGGMYHPDRRPVGLYVADGQQVAPIVTREGPGNFGLLPNGVFCVDHDGTARVIESRAFAAEDPACRIATQSGPMLVIDGALHPAFIQDSDSRLLRNGIGVRDDGMVVFALADTPVNFHTFATYFRDTLKTPNALFLEGRVVRLFSEELGRADLGRPMGPIIGVARSVN